MSKKNMLRAWRHLAREAATEEGYVNENIKVKVVKSGKMVLNEKGVHVEELVPVTVFNTVNKPGSYKAIYKAMKKEGLV